MLSGWGGRHCAPHRRERVRPPLCQLETCPPAWSVLPTRPPVCQGPGHLPAGLFSAWPQPGRQPGRTRSPRRGWRPGLLRLAGGVGEGGRPLWVEAGQGVGVGVEARYTRGGRQLQWRGAPLGGWVLKQQCAQ